MYREWSVEWSVIAAENGRSVRTEGAVEGGLPKKPWEAHAEMKMKAKV
jgi:hypothetical protein